MHVQVKCRPGNHMFGSSSILPQTVSHLGLTPWSHSPPNKGCTSLILRNHHEDTCNWYLKLYKVGLFACLQSRTLHEQRQDKQMISTINCSASFRSSSVRQHHRLTVHRRFSVSQSQNSGWRLSRRGNSARSMMRSPSFSEIPHRG
jgi:hypothetical protein